MGWLVPFYMMNAGHAADVAKKNRSNSEDNIEESSHKIQKESNKPVEKSEVAPSKNVENTEADTETTPTKSVANTEVKTETRVPDTPVKNYDKGLQNGMFFSGIVIGAMLMFFIMAFYNDYKARESKIEKLEREIRELSMKLHKND